MAGRAVGLLVWLLVVYGLCPPSAASKRLPRWLDWFNIILRLALVVLYCLTQLIITDIIPELATKTFKVSLLSIRVVLVLHHLVALALSPLFGRSVSLVLHLRLQSPVSLIVGLLYPALFVVYPLFAWSSPFTSLNNLAILFNYLALPGCTAIVSLHTVVIEVFLQELRSLNNQLEQLPKRPADLEHLLARIAHKRAQLNILVAEVGSGIGPVVAASVITLCLRLSFSLFTNFSMAMEMFTSGKMLNLGDILVVYPARTILKAVVLVALAHSGQRLNDEAAKSQLLLDSIASSNQFLPKHIIWQIGKCRVVFEKEKLSVGAWGFFNIDHTLITMMVGLIFGLVMILVQFQVSEVVLKPA